RRGADRYAALAHVDQLLLDVPAGEPLEEEERRLGVLAGPADDRKGRLRVGGPPGVVAGLSGHGRIDKLARVRRRARLVDAQHEIGPSDGLCGDAVAHDRRYVDEGIFGDSGWSELPQVGVHLQRSDILWAVEGRLALGVYDVAAVVLEEVVPQ